MIKKIVIMAAGKGVRMMPLTKTIPKSLIKINSRPFLYYLIRNIKKAGIIDFAIIIGHKGEMIKKFLKKYGFKATLITQKKRLGTGHALMQAESFVGNENFIVLGGDNLWSEKDLKRMVKDDKMNYIGGIESKEPEIYGVLVSSNSYLKEIVEKPKKFIGNIVNTGLYKFTPEIFNALKKIKKSSRGEYELTDAVTFLAKKKRVKIIKMRDFWLDLGKKSDIKNIEKFLRRT